uniref:CCHC-type domain-containing protein n=1 Tax=Parastrongyloides trichosuri TaxID=131310 RepID=A0A0N4ZKX1_PARTI
MLKMMTTGKNDDIKMIHIADVVKVMRSLSITKLANQENYLLWKEDFSTLMECVGLSFETLKDKKLSMACSAKIVRLTLSDELKKEFLYTETSFELIKDIELKFKKTTIIDIINLKSELYTFQESDPMLMIVKVKTIVIQLKQLDQIIGDTEMCHIILTKLDTRYKIMKTTLTLNIILEDLIQRIKSQSDSAHNNEFGETTFYMGKKFNNYRNKNQNQSVKRNNGKSQLCYNCRGTGHHAKVCPSPSTYSNYANFCLDDSTDNVNCVESLKAIDFIYIKECLKNHITISHISSNGMLADGLTKCFGSERLLEMFRR